MVFLSKALPVILMFGTLILGTVASLIHLGRKMKQEQKAQEENL